MSEPRIVPYRPEWPEEFRGCAAPIRGALAELAVRIDHIGSTSVPGLAAKDIIDIQVTVDALAPAVATAFASAGYLLLRATSDHIPPGSAEPEPRWLKWLVQPPPESRRAHVHVRVQGYPNQRYPILFRDYLRLHPSTAEAYAELKRRLASSLADPSTYPDVKDPAVDLIYLAADDWAARTGWQPGPSDG